MNRKIVIGAVAAIIVAAALGAWWVMRNAHEKDDSSLTLQGNVDIRQVSLAFNANERVAQMLVSEGDAVKAGQVLGRLDTRTAEARLAQAKAQAGGAQQAFDRLRNGSRPEEVAQARANIAAAQADAQLASAQVKRLRGVSADTSGRGVSRLDLDNAISREKVAIAKLQATRQSGQLVIAGPRKEDIAQARNQLDAALAQQALLARALEEAELTAPMDAVVRSRLLEPGDMASPQRPAYTLAITQPKWVRAYVAEADLSRLRTGMPASVSTDSDPTARIAGTLGYISSVAEFTPKTVQTEELRTSLVYEIRVRVDDPQDKLRLGMPATIHLQPGVAPARS